MVCWKCKKQMPEGLKYCGNCGVRLNRTMHFVELLFSKKGLPVLIGLLVLALVIAGVAIWQGRPKTETMLEQTLEASLYVPAEPDEEEPDFLTEIENRNGYEVLSYETTEDGYRAVLRVYAPDVYGVGKKVDVEYAAADEAELLEVLAREIKSAELTVKQVELLFEKTEEGYRPVLTAEFMDAYYGGVIRLYEDIIAGAMERAEES